MEINRYIKVAERKTELTVLLAIILSLGAVYVTASSLTGYASDGLIAEYRFDTGAGDVAYDTAGNNDGTINGASWVKGVEGKALSFDGNNDQVLGPSSFEPYNSNSDKWTMSVWFKINDLPSTEGHAMTILDNNNRYHMQMNSGDDQMRSIPGGNSFTWGWYPSQGEWHHAVLVYDGDGTVKAYANGKLQTEVSGISPYESGNSGGRFAFGSHTGSRYFDGIIDNGKVYSTNLSSSQIKSLYNSGSWRIGSEEDSVRFEKSEGFELYNIDEPINGQNGWSYGGSCSESGCYVTNVRSEDGSRSFVQSDGGGDLYADSLIYEFDKPLNGDIVVEGEYWERSSPNWDGNFWVKACDGSNLAGIGTENPQFEADINNSQAYLNNPGASYQEWTNVRMEIDTRTGDVDFFWEQDNSGASDSYSGNFGSDHKICEFGVGPGGTWYIDDISIRQGKSKVLDMSFSEQNSSHVFDTSGQNNHGQPQNGALQETAGGCKVGRCYSFDGNDDYVNVPDDSSLGITTGSWGGWVKANSWTDSGNGRAYWIDGRNHEYSLFTDSASDGTAGASIGGTYYSVSFDPPSTGNWHHFMTTYDGSNIRFYIDGKEIPQSPTSISGKIDTSSGPLTIGDYMGHGYTVDGNIDQVKVFDRALSQQEIVEETEGLSSDGAVLDVRFDNAGGDHVEDHSVHDNHGILYPNETAGPNLADGIQGNALEFDDFGEYVSVSDDSSLDMTSEISVTSWVYWPENVDGSPLRKLTSGEGWATSMKGNNQMVVYIGGGGSTNNDLRSSFSFQSGKWYHIAFTYSDSDDAAKLFVDGQEDASIDITQELGTNAQDIRIGTTSWWTGGEFNGTIDNTKIFPYAASKSKIKQLYRQGSANIGQEDLPTSCSDLPPGSSSGVYTIDPDQGSSSDSFKVYCEMNENGGGWIKLSIANAGTDDVFTASYEPFGGNDILKCGGDETKYYEHIDSFNQADWAPQTTDVTKTVNVKYSTAGRNLTESQEQAIRSIVTGVSDTTRSVGYTCDDDGSDGSDFNEYLLDENGNSWISQDGWTTTSGEYGWWVHHTDSSNNVFETSSTQENQDDNREWDKDVIIPDEVKMEIGSGGGASWGYEKDYVLVRGSTNPADGLVLDQSFDRVETCGQSDTLSCPSGMNGEIAVDESGEANHGELVNGPTKKSSGDCKVGGCLGFDGSDDYVDEKISLDQDDSSDSYTVTAWFNSDDICQGDQGILGQDNGGYDFFLEVSRDTCGEMMVAAGEDRQILSGGTLESNEWYMIAVKMEGNKIYYSLDGEDWKDSGANRTNYDASHESQISIGSISYDNMGETFDGSIDQVRIYNTSLSKQDVWKLYTRGRERENSMAGPVGWWSFDSVTDDNSYDSAGSNDGTVQGPELTSAKTGSALEFNDGGDIVDLGDIGLLEGAEEATITARIKAPSESGHHRIISQENVYYVGQYGGSLSFYLDDNGDGWSHSSTSLGNFPKNEWVFVTYVKDGNNAYAYINGRQTGSMSAPSTLGSNDRTTLIGDYDTSSNSGTQQGGQDWVGKIDDVRVYPYALSEKQVKQVMNGGSVGVSSGEPTYSVPEDCQEIHQSRESASSGTYRIDPDGEGGSPPFMAYCDMETDDGGWTVVSAYTGADGEEPLVSDTEVSGNPLKFEHYNVDREKKMDLSAVSSESLFQSESNSWIKADHEMFDQNLDSSSQHANYSVTLISEDGSTASAVMGYSNFNIAAGGDYGITTSSHGFDHHNNDYYHLNGGCDPGYLYSYSASNNDGDAGYDITTNIGGWTQTNSCQSNEGGDLKFYAGMR